MPFTPKCWHKPQRWFIIFNCKTKTRTCKINRINFFCEPVDLFMCSSFFMMLQITYSTRIVDIPRRFQIKCYWTSQNVSFVAACYGLPSCVCLNELYIQMTWRGAIYRVSLCLWLCSNQLLEIIKNIFTILKRWICWFYCRKWLYIQTCFFYLWVWGRRE
jgi:hypothetical protein